MQQSPLEYETPQPRSAAWPILAPCVLLLHWLLLFGWGLALNDSAKGYLYCRLAMPGRFEGRPVPWIFTLMGTGLILGLGLLDRARRRIPLAVALLPAALFVATQVFALWLHWSSVEE